MARHKNKGRNISGVLLLDKPQGGSSNQVLQQVKRLFGAAKAGHTGSLDPLATGMLPVCFGEATKISAFLLDADKRYHLRCQLGVATTTGDTEGEVIETQDVSAITEEDIKKVLPDFIGEIEQVPPMYSALKHNGERLYKLARQGIVVERKSRLITIYDIEFISYSRDEQQREILELEVHCSKGTYVRTLVEDIAKALGCGSHITSLRRLSVGPYSGEMLTVDQLIALAAQGTDALDACLQPIDSGVSDWPDVHLDPDAGSSAPARPLRPRPKPWLCRASCRRHRFRRPAPSPANRHGSPEPLRGECDVPRPRQSRRSRAPEYVADQLPRLHGDARRSPISPETRAVRVCACRETTCPTSGSSDGRTGHIRKACRHVLTRRGHCRSDRSAAVRSNGTRQGIRGMPPLFRTVPQTQATSWENHATASRDASLTFGYLLDIHRAFLCDRTKAERYGREGRPPRPPLIIDRRQTDEWPMQYQFCN